MPKYKKEAVSLVRRLLDKNEIPFDLPEKMKMHILKKIESVPFNRYPEQAYAVLREKLATYCGFSADTIVPGNGGDEILWMLFSRYVKPGDSVLVFSPTFSEYYRLADLFGANLCTVQTDLDGDEPRFDHALFLRRMAKLKPSLVLVDSPNNPTGQSHPVSFIGKAVALCESTIVIDEAYGEFARDNWLSSMRGNDLPANVVVLKTLSKAWGLAGLRLGYAVCGEKAALDLNGARSPFNVNILSRTAAEVVLEHTEAMLERVKDICVLRDAFICNVNRLQGWRAFRSDANFVLVRAPFSWSVLSSSLGDLCLKCFALSPETEDSICWLRVSIGTEEDMDSVISFFATMQRR